MIWDKAHQNTDLKKNGAMARLLCYAATNHNKYFET
jgi:hypothetical protein